MTLSHISRLYFEGRDEAAKKRAQKLKAAGFISERVRRATERSVLFLARKGFEALHNEGHLSEFPPLSWKALEKRMQVSELTLRHELEIQDVKTALTLAVNQTGNFSIAQFSTWPLLYEFRVTLPTGGTTFARPEILLKPDGFIQLMEKDGEGQEFRRLFFLEVDRSTETLNTLLTKAIAYREYYRTGGLAARFGAPKDAFNEYPFRVLMVCKTAERRTNIAERLLQNTPPILTHVCLTTLEEVTTNPLGAIWIRPIDYREAARDASLDTGSSHEGRSHRKQADRENLVDGSVKRVSLLA
jgi:hypothetical protein